jgi:hypothetical protein
MEELLSRGARSEAKQGGVGPFWRESVKGEAQAPENAAVIPAGPPPGTTPTQDFERK